MKHVKVLSALSLLALAGAANAEVSGSMGIASSYLWRGYDLGSGTPAVSGDLHYSNSGFYGGVWGSSGDTLNGTEYDLYAGWGGSAGPVSLDFSYWTYAYPTSIKLNPGNLSEFVASVGVGPVTGFLYYNLNAPGLNGDGDPANGDYAYYGVKAKFGPFTALVGHHNDQKAYLTHADLSYAFNDNLTFTVSAPLDVSSNPYFDSTLGDFVKPEKASPTFVASYSVPFGK